MNLRYSSRFSTQCARNALAETDVLGLIYFSYRPTRSCESMTSAAQSYCPLIAFRRRIPSVAGEHYHRPPWSLIMS